MGLKYSLFLVICVIASVLVTLIVDRQLLSPPITEPPLTKDQADKVLKQLTEVRKSLQRIERNQAEKGRRPALPETATAPTKGRPAMGKPDAKITVVEFTDYQCPFCRRFATTTFDKLKQTYIDTGQVRWVVLDMPLSFHKEAMTASRASHCANEQGKFWEFRELLYQNQDKLLPDHLAGYARDVGLEAEAFDQCFTSNRYQEDIERDQEAAKSERITGTPTFVIGRTTDDIITGQRIVGAQPYRAFTTVIDKQLAAE